MRNRFQFTKSRLALLWTAPVAWVTGTPSLLFPAQAQVVPVQGSANTQVSQDGNVFDISGGAQAEGNLFHNFESFDLNEDQTANFLSDSGVFHIVGQVSGLSPSYIDGLVQVSGSDANLYLVNPAGILFGPSGQLSLSGSFTATTADQVGFGENWLNVLAGETNYTAFSAAPSAFAFSADVPGSVINQGDLAVEAGESLSLLGNNVVNEGRLAAPGGEIGLVAVGGNRTVRLGIPGSLLSLEVEQETPLGSNSIFSPVNLPTLVTGNSSAGASRLIVNSNGQVLLDNVRIEPEEVSVTGEITTRRETDRGGTIALLGRSVDVISATVDASGATGGTVRVGRGLGTEDNLPKSDITLFDIDSVVRADGLTGAGGEIAIGAQRSAYLYGALSAKGETRGGFIETSANYLNIGELRIEASGQTQGGKWLVDPVDIDIVDSITGANQITASSIETALNNNIDVELETTSGMPGRGDIALLDSINQTGASTASLTLTGRRFGTNGSTINLASTGALTFNLNAVNPEAVTSGDSVESAIASIDNVMGDRALNLGDGVYNFSDRVSLNTDVSIVGASRDGTLLNIDADRRLFRVEANSDISLENLTFSAAAGRQGGGIFNLGTLNLNNITAVGNTSPTGSNGGAIDSLIDSRLTVADSIFSNNQTAQSGGAISAARTALNISNSLFENNDAQNGGAISALDGSSVAVSNSRIESNRATNVGGAIRSISSDVTLTDSVVKDNIANVAGGLSLRSNAVADIVSTRFENNSSTVVGGGILAQDGSIVNVRDRSIFQGNSSAEGGGIYANGNSVIDVRNGQFVANRAEDGGGIHSQGGNVSISAGTRFERNVATLEDGGGLSINNGATANLENVVFAENTAAEDGGGAIAEDSSTITVDNVQFVDNIADDDGGGLYISGNSQANVTISQFEGNSASDSGGGVYASRGSTATVEDVVFSGNSAISGGGLSVNSRSTVAVSDATFEANSANSGGAIQLDDTSRLSMESSTLAENRTTGQGGGLFNEGTAELVNTTLSGNVAQGEGGAIANQAPNAELTLRSTTISNNESGANGGGITNSSGATTRIVNTIVAENRGAIANDVSGDFIDQGNNLIGQSDGSTGFTTSTLVGRLGNSIDPSLSPLADNGGATRTQLIASDSLAVEAGADNGSLAFDQRGLSRVVGTAIDIGAVEIADPMPRLPEPPEVPETPSVPENPEVPENPDDSNLLITLDGGSRLLETDGVSGRAIASLDNNWTALSNNSEPNADNETVSRLERTFGRSFEDYWDLPLGNSMDFDGVQSILRRAQEEYKVNSAIIYAVFLPEQIGLNTGEDKLYVEPAPAPDDLLHLALVMPEGELVRYQLPVTRERATRQVSLLRSAVGDPEDLFGYQPLTQQLYRWLLAPLEKDLETQGIQNLMYALDTGLRTSPITAMRDYQGFSLERYGISVVPNMGLTQAEFGPAVKRPTVAMGVSQFEMASPLPAVPIELAVVKDVVSAASTVLNEETTIGALESVQALEKPGVLHLATHANFDHYSPESSSISMWDQPLSMKAFAELDWLESDLELLILSACSTALSSANAELGFAGLAAAAGVDATVGSLWEVSDVGTLALMSEFYTQLESTDLRFEALRQAQLSLLEGKTRIENGNLRTSQGVIELPDEWGLPAEATLEHPFFWSAFTMVGNPW